MNLNIAKLKTSLIYILGLYGKFALAHSLFKLFRLIFINLRRSYAWRKVPAAKPDPLALAMQKNFPRLHDHIHDLVYPFPDAPLIKFQEGPNLILICNNAESVQWLLKDEFSSFTKPASHEEKVFLLLREFIGDSGIFTLQHGEHLSKSSHEKWLKQRKISSKIFTKSNFENFMFNVFVKKALKLNKVIETRKEKYIDMQDMFFKFTMDSIEKLFFGNEVNSIEGEMSFYGKNFDLAHQQLLPLLFGNIPAALLEAFAPFPFDKVLFNWSRAFSKRQKIFTKSIKNLDSHIYKFIERAKNDRSMGERRDLIANFLNANIYFGGKPMTDQVLRDIVLNMSIAGRDTTACALTWMFYELSIHKDVQHKLQKEIETALKDNKEIYGVKVPRLSDFSVEKLPYLNAVIHETLRLHPPVPANFKDSTKDCYYPDGTFIPAGSQVHYNSYSLNRNRNVYHKPDSFLPERWIPFKEPSMYEFPVFQAGPRFCLGKDMAKIEIKTVACILLQKFNFSLKKGEEIFYSLMLTMSLANIPAAKPDPLALEEWKNFHRLHDHVLDLVYPFPDAPLVKFQEGPNLILICNNAESVQWLLKDEFSTFTKPGSHEEKVFSLLREFIGDSGIFTLQHGEHLSKSSHEKWLKQRKISSKIFTKSNFENFMFNVFVEKALKLNKVIETRKEKYIDMQDMFFKFTMDSIEKLFFGNEVNSIEGEMSFYGKNFDLAHQQLLPLLFGNLPACLLEQIAPFPFDKFLFIWSRAFSKRQKIFTKSIKNLDSHIYKFIEQAKTDKSMGERRDLIANFLNANIYFGGKPMTDKVLRDIVLNMSIAGRDTTACALTWMFYELSIHKDVQHKLQKEIETALKDNKEIYGVKVPRLSDFSVENLPYLNAVIHETLRLHPPVPANFKESTKDCYYPDGTFVPAGSQVHYNSYSLNRNRNVYHKPDSFLPERWIPFKEPSMYEFPVFQAGPRFCLGKDMAKIEIKTVACILLQKFNFSLKEGEEIFYTLMLTMSLANSIKRTSFNLWLEPTARV
eukprot:maker-scaffold_23-snap-gene-5.4-mRNA-1 protein AED:0.01 eAED:0.01 QI:0/0/0/1/0/0/2/0/1024